MMHMVVRHTNADGIQVYKGITPGPPRTVCSWKRQSPALKSETADLADAMYRKATQYTNPLINYDISEFNLASYILMYMTILSLKSPSIAAQCGTDSCTHGCGIISHGSCTVNLAMDMESCMYNCLQCNEISTRVGRNCIILS